MTFTVAMKSLGMIEPTPTGDVLPRRLADFPTLADALDYAANGVRGVNFYSARGDLVAAVTYAALRERAVGIAERLSGAGFAAGDRIALVAATDPDFVAYFLACQYVSILPVPLPLPTSFGGREGYVSQLKTQMESCGAAAVLAPGAMVDLVRQAGASLDLHFCGSFAEFEAQGIAPGPLRLPGPDDLAYLQYSSGSTRFPHGIAITHRALMANCAGQGRHGVALKDDDRCVSWLPFYHDMGLVGTLLTPVTNQVSTDFLATEDFARRPLQWLTVMTRNRGTISYSPTFGYDICSRRAGSDALQKLDLSAWRVAGIGGDMIRPEVIRRFAQTFAAAGFRPTALVPSYGLAECTLAVSFAKLGRGVEVDLVDEDVLSGERPGRVNGHGHHGVNGTRLNGVNGITLKHHSKAGVRRREVVNCGRPLPEYELEIRGEAGRRLEEREIGRIFVRGESVMQAYYNDRAATEAVLGPDGWLDTGDMGYLRRGNLYVVGRAKDMIIINGRNHWPQDIEWAVEQLPGVRNGDIAAVSLPGNDDEEVPTVLVQCRARESEERQSFADRIKRQIMDVTGIQCRIELVPPRTLPRTSSGKLSRSKARQQFLSGGIPALAY